MRKNTGEKVGVNKNLKERLGLDKLKIATAMGLAAVTAAAVVGVGGVESKHEAPAAPAATSSQEFDLAAITKIITGGNGDSQSAWLLSELARQGMINWSENNYLVAYPADIANDELSANIGRQIMENEYWAAHGRGDHTIMVAFSLGNIPQAQAVTNIANANGGQIPADLTVVAYGSPNGQSGFFNSSFGRVSEPFINIAGISTDQTLPSGANVYDVASQNDFWARTGQDTWLGQIAKASAIGQGHRVPSPNEPHMSWTGTDGVHYESYDVGVHPWTMVLSANGMYVNDGYNDFFNAIVPVSNGRDPAPDPNARAAIDALARGFDEQAGSGQTFQILFKFIPAFPFQVGLDVVTKVPDAVVHTLEAGVQGVAYGPQAAVDSINNAPASTSSPETAQVFGADLGDSHPLADALKKLSQAVTQPAPQLAEVTVSPEAVDVPETPEVVNTVVEQVTDVVDDVVDQAQEVVSSVEPQAPEVVEPVAPAPVETPAPVVVETPAPVVETSAPVVVEAPAPVVEAPAPVVEAPAPVVEAPAPVVEAPAPAVVETPAPVVVETPAPVEVPAPVQEVVDQVQQVVTDAIGDLVPAPAS